MTNALKAEFVMTKKNLFQAIRGHYDFVNAQVFVFAWWWVIKEPNGNWIVVADNLSRDKVYSYNR